MKRMPIAGSASVPTVKRKSPGVPTEIASSKRPAPVVRRRAFSLVGPGSRLVARRLQPDYVFCLQAFLALSQIVFDLLPLKQGAMTLPADGTVVNKHVRATFTLNEAVTFGVIEPLYTSSLTRRHLNYSGFLFWNRLACREVTAPCRRSLHKSLASGGPSI
ncbi:protein of unknown function [Pseudomonas sp. JV241A]|nr:protein of unknown function [Pseudomonas sp. JV241A]